MRDNPLAAATAADGIQPQHADRPNQTARVAPPIGPRGRALAQRRHSRCRAWRPRAPEIRITAPRRRGPARHVRPFDETSEGAAPGGSAGSRRRCGGTEPSCGICGGPGRKCKGPWKARLQSTRSDNPSRVIPRPVTRDPCPGTCDPHPGTRSTKARHRADQLVIDLTRRSSCRRSAVHEPGEQVTAAAAADPRSPGSSPPGRPPGRADPGRRPARQTRPPPVPAADRPRAPPTTPPASAHGRAR
jgi:hypothetical protein